MKLNKLFILLALFAFAPVAMQAQEATSAAPSVSIPVLDAEIPKAIVVAEPTAGEAVTAAVSPDQAPNGVEAVVLEVFLGLVKKFPWLATLILFMGMCRVFAKPAVSLIHTLVDLTPSKTDDGLFNGALLFFTTHPAGKAIAFGLDWVTSIKIKAPAK